MFILKKGHQPGVYVPLRALFLVVLHTVSQLFYICLFNRVKFENSNKRLRLQTLLSANSVHFF